MSRIALPLQLDAPTRSTLDKLTRSASTPQSLALRSRIILAAADGANNQQIATELQVPAVTVGKWRRSFASNGLEGLRDAPRSGRPLKHDADIRHKVQTRVCQQPENQSRWTVRTLAAELGLPSSTVHAMLRAAKLQPHRIRTFTFSPDPDFEAKLLDIVGLYLNPPENALVLCVDEKPSIQALERAQGWLRLPNGKALNGRSHGYKRHGTTTLFAAFDIATGQVIAGHYNRRRRREFLDFMNQIVAAYPDREIHVVLDNLNTHKPKEDRWLKRHPKVHIHFTPTYSSWLNQVECWFSILSQQALKGVSFTSPAQLREAIDKFIKAYNKKAAPFEWTKAVVHQTAPKLPGDACRSRPRS